ncbi:MAG: hypothetical protein ACO29O_05015, partial [Chitinophagaceae bacterium]
AQQNSYAAYTTSTSSKAPKLKNEIRFNIATAIAGLPELNYEAFIADNVGLGMAVAVSLETSENMEIRSLFIPYARIYFSEKPNAGFFIEGNLGFAGQKGTKYDSFNGQSTGVKSYFNGGFGAAVGWKFLTRNNYVGELYGGLGRLFGDNLIVVYPRVGITLGKRF